MEQHDYEDLLEQVDDLIEAMLTHESELYIALETAHQLRDELTQIEPSEELEDE